MLLREFIMLVDDVDASQVEALPCTPHHYHLRAAMRGLFISYEFLSVFSGNGVYARTIVKALKDGSLPGGCCNQMFVLAARPADRPMETQDEEARDHAVAPHSVVDVPVDAAKWGRLDQACAWQEFADGCIAAAGQVQRFAPDVVYVVDWSAMPAWEALVKAAPSLSDTPCVFLNFRLFTTVSSRPHTVQ
jgi:hypothetical protein